MLESDLGKGKQEGDQENFPLCISENPIPKDKNGSSDFTFLPMVDVNLIEGFDVQPIPSS